MKGHILDFSVQTNSGIISGDDNQRYTFQGADWMEQDPPRRGMQVDFATIGDQATQIYALGVSVMGLIEGIIYLTKQDDEFEQEYVVQKKPWF